MQVIPIQDEFNQTLYVTLNGQSTQLDIYQNEYGLFMDVLVNGAAIISGIIAEDRNRIIRDLYLGYIGDFCFIDTQGSSDPTSPGLGGRYVLCYLDTFDLAPGQG
jgi:hypothetical protein